MCVYGVSSQAITNQGVTLEDGSAVTRSLGRERQAWSLDA